MDKETEVAFALIIDTIKTMQATMNVLKASIAIQGESIRQLTQMIKEKING